MKSSGRKSTTMQNETRGRKKSPPAYHREQKVPHSYSPRRASLPLQSQNRSAELSGTDDASFKEIVFSYLF